MSVRSTVAVLLICAVPVFAQLGKSATGDARIRSALNQLDLKYKVTDLGNFRMVFSLDEGRTQLVFINSKTETYHGLEIREVWAPAYKSENPFSAAVANRLLTDSDENKIGAWAVYRDNDNAYVAKYVAKIDAGADPQSLQAVITAVIKCADAMEKELTGSRDEF